VFKTAQNWWRDFCQQTGREGLTPEKAAEADQAALLIRSARKPKVRARAFRKAGEIR
jgi:hypothetical protein